MLGDDTAPFFRDFAQTAEVSLPGGFVSINAIFDNAFFDASIGQNRLDETAPRITVQTVDIPGLTIGAAVRVSGKQWRVTQIQPDGTGVSTVLLSPENGQDPARI